MAKGTTALASIVSVTVLLGGLYWGLRTTERGPAARVPQSQTFSMSIAAPHGDETQPQPANFPVFRVTQGEMVTFLITSGRPGSVHVHIYEKQIELQPGRQVDLTFQATNAGRFPIHLHDPAGAMEHLATLEVQPR